jgi:chaperonin cofactor prefoldin
VNNRARSPSEEGMIQRAKTFANVEWLMKWQPTIDKAIEEVHESLQAVIQAGHILIDTDSELAKEIEKLNTRIDIVNKRLRKLENQK